MASVLYQDFEPELCESGLQIQKSANTELDDDGKTKRTGNYWTAGAHIITGVIGSGVLSLAWGMAQIGWIAGVATLSAFSAITLFTSSLLADCYRSPDPVSGKRNYSYMEAVEANLGGAMPILCGIAQYANLVGTTIGYSITASISMVAVQKSNCFHMRGHKASCSSSHNPYMIGLGILEVLLSQIPNLHKLSVLSTIAAIMSFGYASIGTGLAFSTVISGKGKRTNLTGVEVGIDVSAAEKTWRMFQAFGDIAFAYTYSPILIAIQDTLKSQPPENKVMKKANVIGLLTTTAFYMMCGCFGYAAFGNNAPGNMLTGFGFYEPFWLIDLANVFIVVHLIGAYQVFAQPLFSAVESRASRAWPKSDFVNKEYKMGIGKKCKLSINFLRLTWRTTYVIFTVVLAMLLPFFNDILGLIGAISYWPLTVFFPIEMYIAQKKIGRWTSKWVGLQLINLVCLLIAMAAACGSIEGLIRSVSVYKPFKFKD